MFSDNIEFKKPVLKNKGYISQATKNIKICLSEIKIKNIKKLMNSNGHNLTLYLSPNINNEAINDIQNIDKIAFNKILLNNNDWFNNNLDENELSELYKTSYCNQTNTLNCILSNNIPYNITIDNIQYIDDEKLLNILLNVRELKKYVIYIELIHAGLYFYPELSINKWLIKSINITTIENDKCEWYREDIENEWENELINTINIINKNIENKHKEIDDQNNLKQNITTLFNEIKDLQIADNLWENKINSLKNLIINPFNRILSTNDNR